MTAPDSLLDNLMPHQKDSLNSLMWREIQAQPGGILADEMGLGKTRSMIALIIQRKLEMKQKRQETVWNDEKRVDVAKKHGLCPLENTLIVVPPILVNYWVEEVKHLAAPDFISIFVYTGNKSGQLTPESLGSFDIVIATYRLVSKEVLKKPTSSRDEEIDDDAENDGKHNTILLNEDSILARIAWMRIILDDAHFTKNTSYLLALILF